MAKQDCTQRLGGTVQIDDVYLGGERAGGNLGFYENKVPFVAAVSLKKHGHPIYLRLNLARGVTRDLLSKWAQVSLDAAARVISDGRGCLAAVVDADCPHQPIVVGALKSRNLPQFKWVNMVQGNMKTTLAGAFHSANYRKYAKRYRSAFANRFNRRFDLRGLVAHLIFDLVRGKPAKKSGNQSAC